MATFRRPQVLLFGGFGVFVLTLGYIVVSSLTRRTAPVFEPSPVGAPLRSSTEAGPDTVTIDSGQEDVWRFFDLDEGTVLFPGDSTGWDLAVMRFRLRAARTVADLGLIPFPSSPTDTAALITRSDSDSVSDSRDFGRWYGYSMLSHLLSPAGQVYSLRTDEGRAALVQMLSYYCPGLKAGCLTFRYLLWWPADSSHP